MSYAIPTNELTLTDIRTFRDGAIRAGIARALALGVARVEGELVVREALPHVDFATTWAADYYITIAGPVAVGWQTCGSLAHPAPSQLGVGKVAVFYKVADATADTDITAVRFRVGATGSTTKAVFFTQLPIWIKLEPEVYFTEPVVYDPQDWVYPEAYWNVAGGGVSELIFGCFIVERTGGIVS